MPGKNCASPHCSVSGAKEFQGTSLFKLPSRTCDEKWKSAIVDVLSKYREVDKPLKARILKGNLCHGPSRVEINYAHASNN